MINTELRPLILNFADEDEDLEEGDSPVLPKSDDVAGEPGDGDADGFGLDDDQIEAPSEEEF